MPSNIIPDLSGPPNFEAFDPLLSSLPTDLAFQLMTVRYITVATLAISIWDILINIFNDYRLLFEHPIRSPTIVYFISRSCCLGLTICATVLRIRSKLPIPMCRDLERAVVILYSAAIVLTSLLFFFRTRAVFNGNQWIVAISASLWLAVLGGSLAFVVFILNPTNAAAITDAICINVEINAFVAMTTIIPLINDTLVFLAITWHLSRHSYVHHTLENGFRSLVFGDYLPAFSKAFLHDGQVYYLTIVTMNLIAVIMLFNNSVSGILRTIFAVPNVTLMNIMACRVFRNTILFDNSRATDTSHSLISWEVCYFPWEGESGPRQDIQC